MDRSLSVYVIPNKNEYLVKKKIAAGIRRNRDWTKDAEKREIHLKEAKEEEKARQGRRLEVMAKRASKEEIPKNPTVTSKPATKEKKKNVPLMQPSKKKPEGKKPEGKKPARPLKGKIFSYRGPADYLSVFLPGMSMTSPGMALPSPALTSPSRVLPSPASASKASPAVSLPSLQSPMTPSLTDDRHRFSSVSSSTSSVSFAAEASNHTTTSTALTSTSSSGRNGHHNHHHSSSTRSQTNSSQLTSSYKHSSSNHLSHHHHQSNYLSHHHHQFGFGLGHLLGAGGGMNGPNVVMPSIPGPPGNLSFPFPLGGLKPHRNPVGANPHDINNPLSVNQLIGQCNFPEL